MPSYPTVDLAQAYADAERILSLRGETERRNQMVQMEREAQQQAEQEAKLRAAAQSGWADLQAAKTDPAARAQILGMLRSQNKELASWSDEALLTRSEELIRMQLGIEAEKADPIGNLYAIDEGGRPVYQPAEKAAGKPKYIEPEKGPGPGPTGTWSPPFQGVGADGKPGLYTQHSITGQVRPVNVGGAAVAPPPKADAPGAGLNDRQRGGLNMVRDNMLAYAAARSGKSREEVDAIYAQGGPKAVGDLIRSSPERALEGANARFLQAFPLGEAIVDAANADLVASRKGGGAGMASYQNPTGMIATADFTVGEAQVPGMVYPKETQAQIIEQRLREAETGLGAPQRSDQRIGASDLPPPAALQQLREGKITTFANGQQWTVKDGKAVRVQ